MMEKKIQRIFLIILFLFFAVLTYIFFHTENLRIGYEIENLRKERDKLKEEIEILKVEKEKLRNLKRVEKIARDLGMREIEREQIVILKVSKDKQKDFLHPEMEMAIKAIDFLKEKEKK